MQVFRTHAEVTQAPSAVAIGIFDGVHLGHQALLHTAVSLARADRLRSLAYTFDPHPAQVLNPPLAPRMIEPLSRRLERFERLGLDAVLVEEFTMAFAATEAEPFVTETLVQTLGAKHVVVGAGFTFGSKQRGHVPLLHQLGMELGFLTHPVEHVRAQGIEVSSTKVREFVRAGQMAGARLLLGRPYRLFGQVVHGAQRGTTLGFPTANVAADNVLVPGRGVYVARATCQHGAFGAVVNIGVAPTFADSQALKVEVHLLDYQGPSLYGSSVEVDILDRLRDEQRFAGVEALKAQISVDVQRARARLQEL